MAPSQPAPARVHPFPVRAMHWINAVAMMVMIFSGWGIYNDYVIVHGLHVPSFLRLGAWAAPSLLWHFAGMWLLVLNGGAYLLYGLITGRLRERLWPIRLSDLRNTLRDTFHLRIEHDDVTRYNAVQKLLYLLVILAAVGQVVTGLCVWKPVQLSAIVEFLGGFQALRLAHFIGMAVIVGFLLVHITLAALVPSTLKAMLTGGPRVPAGRRP